MTLPLPPPDIQLSILTRHSSRDHTNVDHHCRFRDYDIRAVRLPPFSLLGLDGRAMLRLIQRATNLLRKAKMASNRAQPSAFQMNRDRKLVLLRGLWTGNVCGCFVEGLFCISPLVFWSYKRFFRNIHSKIVNPLLFLV